MSLLLATVLAASAQTDELSGCAMLAFSRAPSRSRTVVSERVEVCRASGREPADAHFNLFLVRTSRGAAPVTLNTSTRACPAARERLVEVERLAQTTLEFLPRERQIVVIGDGTRYRLDIRWVPWGDGPHTGSLRLESNVGTPLAEWTDAMFGALETCWLSPDGSSLPEPPPAAR